MIRPIGPAAHGAAEPGSADHGTEPRCAPAAESDSGARPASAPCLEGAAGPAGRRAALPAEAYAAALVGLPQMGPARLTALLATGHPAVVWRRVAAGDLPAAPEVVRALGPKRAEIVRRWRAASAGLDVAEAWHDTVRAGVRVALVGTPAYPSALAGDVEPPAVVFHRGALETIEGPRVAIVGTRRCSATGAGVAFELGRDLASAGVAVVSGLASGIDGAAHRGALAAAGAPPVGVVGSGLDVVYPRDQHELWQAVAAAGALLSEAPLGGRPERWRFPARNRIIAALADLVVVVESHRRGGSLHTVDEADRRGRDVMAVPGSVRNPAASGTNELLAEGRAPVCSVDDVLVALGLGRARTGDPVDRRVPPDHADRPVLDAIGWQPSTLDQLVLRTGRDLAGLAPALDRLCDAGWVTRHGGWYERVAAGSGRRA